MKNNDVCPDGAMSLGTEQSSAELGGTEHSSAEQPRVEQSNVEFGNAEIGRTEFEKAAQVNAELSNVELSGVELVDVQQTSVELSKAEQPRVEFGNVELGCAEKLSVEPTNVELGMSSEIRDELSQMLGFARERYIPVMLDDTRALLYQTVRAAQPKRILEIGTAVGYSGIIMLTACKNATLNTMEMDEGLAQIARQNFAKAEVNDRVNIFVGDARQIVLQLTGEYDLIFLDGPKGQYETFLPYLTDVLAVGGTLVCDNVLYKGLVENIPDDKRHKHITVARNMRAFLDDVTTNPRFQTTLYRIGDGVTVSKKLY